MRKPNPSIGKKTVTQALVWSLVISIFAGSISGSAGLAYASSEASAPALSKALEARRKPLLQAVSDLRFTIKRERAKAKPDGGALVSAFSAVASEMRSFKREIESVGDLITTVDPTLTAYFAVVTSYYQILGLLDTVAHAYINQPYFKQMVNELFLELPAQVASGFQTIQGALSEQNKLDSFDIIFTMQAMPSGKTRIIYSPRESNRNSLAAFIAFPSEELAKNQIKMTAFKLLFLEHAALNNYLYGDEKSNGKLDASAEAALVSLQSNAETLASEHAFREQMTPGLIDPALGSVLAVIKKSEPQFREFFKKVASTYPKFVDKNASAAEIADFADKLAQNFVLDKDGSLKQFRKSKLWPIFKSSPLYLTELSSPELRSALAEAAQIAEFDVLGSILTSFMLGISKDCKTGNCFSVGQEEQFNEMVFNFVNSVFTPEKFAENIAQPFERRLKNHDLTTSLDRYRLADMVIQSVQWYESIKRTIKKTDRILSNPMPTVDEKDRKMLLSSLPEAPDAGNVLAALLENEGGDNFKRGDYKSAWVTEAIASGLSKLAKTDPSKVERARFAIANDVVMGVQNLSKLASYVNKKMQHGETLAHIQRLRSQLQDKYYPYRWYSMKLKLELLWRKATDQDSKLVLFGLLDLGSTAEKIGASSLLRQVQAATKNYLEGNTSALVPVVESVENGMNFVKSKREFIAKVFAQPGVRDAYLRQILSNPKVFKSYASYQMHTIEDTLPGLFLAIKLPSDVAGPETLTNEKPVTLYDLTKRLIGDFDCESGSHCDMGAIARLGGGAAVNGAFAKALKEMNRSDLDASVDLPFKPRELLESAMSGNREYEEFSVFGKVLEKVFGYAGIAVEKTYGPMEDSYWPTEFKVRDLYPALHDLRQVDAKKFAKTPTGVRVARAVLSTFLSPYLKSAAQANNAAVRTLLHPEANKACMGVMNGLNPFDAFQDDHTKQIYNTLSKQNCTDEVKILVGTKAYRDLVKEAGDENGELLENISDEATKWRRRVAQVKNVSQKTQHYSNFLFMGTLFLPVPQLIEIPAMGFMALSSFADFSTDIIQLVDYGMTYAEAQPFAHSGMLNEGLLSYKDLARIHEEFFVKAETVRERAPMDLWWYSGIVGQWHAKIQYWRMMKNRPKPSKKIVLAADAPKQPPKSSPKTKREIDAVAQAYSTLGVSPNATAAEVKSAYKKGLAANHPDKFPAGSPEQAKAITRFKTISEAYKLIQGSGKN